MKKSKQLIYSATVVAILIVGFFIFYSSESSKHVNTAPASILQAYIGADDLHEAEFSEVANLIFRNEDFSDLYGSNKRGIVQLGITAHHLPTAYTFLEDFYRALSYETGPRDIFVVIGPDHFESCLKVASTTQKAYSTPFGVLEVEEEIVNDLVANNITLEDNCFDGEHSIGVHALFIKKLYPQAKIVPVLLSASVEESDTELIIEVLKKHRDRITVIGSVDFSHYRDYKTAQAIDLQTEEIIKNMDVTSLKLKNVDSPATVSLIVGIARYFNADPVILGRANSCEFNGKCENTTGYINVLFNSEK